MTDSRPDGDGDDAVVVRFDESNRPPSVAVAEVLEVTLDESGHTLFDYVDPDALDELVADAQRRSSVTVEFEVDGTPVTVHGEGCVVVHTA